MSVAGQPVDEDLAVAMEEDLLAGGNGATERHLAGVGASFAGAIWSPWVDALDEEVLRILQAYWTDLPAGRRAPRAAAVNPARMKPALGYVMLLDVLEGGRDFRYRVYGSAIAARSGFEATGRTVSELPVAPMTEYFLASYRACLRRIEPLFTRHAPPVMLHVVGWDRLILPLEDDDGSIVRLLVGNVPRRWPPA
ncbi:PAS domain-containing protein [Marinibaculum pumilum]|uniref:PAS domain-containing protein n=1 Tax=Marinibaculum pumilum TaxID=1766165 RepID=A0ABV7KVK2_9PROT